MDEVSIRKESLFQNAQFLYLFWTINNKIQVFSNLKIFRKRRDPLHSHQYLLIKAPIILFSVDFLGGGLLLECGVFVLDFFYFVIFILRHSP